MSRGIRGCVGWVYVSETDQVELRVDECKPLPSARSAADGAISASGSSPAAPVM